LEKELFEEPYSESLLRRELKQPFFFGIAATLEGELVGYCTCWIVEKTCEVHRLGVTKRFQGMGIGKNLLKEAIEECKRRKVEEVFLEVSEKNERALGLYRQLGFRTVGKRKNYYRGEKALVLKLNIREESC